MAPHSSFVKYSSILLCPHSYYRRRDKLESQHFQLLSTGSLCTDFPRHTSHDASCAESAFRSDTVLLAAQEHEAKMHFPRYLLLVMTACTAIDLDCAAVLRRRRLSARTPPGLLRLHLLCCSACVAKTAPHRATNRRSSDVAATRPIHCAHCAALLRSIDAEHAPSDGLQSLTRTARWKFPEVRGRLTGAGRVRGAACVASNGTQRGRSGMKHCRYNVISADCSASSLVQRARWT